jgi:hypothetical protein
VHPNPVKLTDDTGYFWFFDSANIELMTKVVDGRGLNGKFWFFYGALSDVQYRSGSPTVSLASSRSTTTRRATWRASRYLCDHALGRTLVPGLHW